MSGAKFTFDTVFAGETDVASETALARKVKTLTQAELDAIKSAAVEEGRQSAEIRALEALAAGVEDAVIAVREAITRASGQVEGLRAESAQLALAAARTLAGSALSHFPAETVENALRQAMHQAIGEPRLTLRASPVVAEALRPKLDQMALQEGFDGRVAVIADPAMANADCRIEWRGGGIERSMPAIEAGLAQAAAQYFGQTSPVAFVEE